MLLLLQHFVLFYTLPSLLVAFCMHLNLVATGDYKTLKGSKAIYVIKLLVASLGWPYFLADSILKDGMGL